MSSTTLDLRRDRLTALAEQAGVSLPPLQSLYVAPAAGARRDGQSVVLQVAALAEFLRQHPTNPDREHLRALAAGLSTGEVLRAAFEAAGYGHGRAEALTLMRAGVLSVGKDLTRALHQCSGARVLEVLHAAAAAISPIADDPTHLDVNDVVEVTSAKCVPVPDVFDLLNYRSLPGVLNPAAVETLVARTRGHLKGMSPRQVTTLSRNSGPGVKLDRATEDRLLADGGLAGAVLALRVGSPHGDRLEALAAARPELLGAVLARWFGFARLRPRITEASVEALRSVDAPVAETLLREVCFTNPHKLAVLVRTAGLGQAWLERRLATAPTYSSVTVLARSSALSTEDILTAGHARPVHLQAAVAHAPGLAYAFVRALDLGQPLSDELVRQMARAVGNDPRVWQRLLVTSQENRSPFLDGSLTVAQAAQVLQDRWRAAEQRKAQTADPSPTRA